VPQQVEGHVNGRAARWKRSSKIGRPVSSTQTISPSRMTSPALSTSGIDAARSSKRFMRLRLREMNRGFTSSIHKEGAEAVVFPDKRDLLHARVIIAAYNQHVRSPFSRAFGRLALPIYSGLGRPTTS
jgi:hypothetical protein